MKKWTTPLVTGVEVQLHSNIRHRHHSAHLGRLWQIQGERRVAARNVGNSGAIARTCPVSESLSKAGRVEKVKKKARNRRLLHICRRDQTTFLPHLVLGGVVGVNVARVVDGKVQLKDTVVSDRVVVRFDHLAQRAEGVALVPEPVVNLSSRRTME